MNHPLRVLMFGWEFPPAKSGGLGTACHGLTKGLSRKNVEVTFVMPVAPDGARAKFVKLIGADQLSEPAFIEVPSTLEPYHGADQYEPANTRGVYGKNVFAEAKRFAQVAKQIALTESHDVIHAHDWMAFDAGIQARNVSGKPLIAHIHSTEHDRTGGKPNKLIARTERQGLLAADRIIANSEYTKENVRDQYRIPAKKISVVHWGIDDHPHHKLNYRSPLNEHHKIVLFLGRITEQKGPLQFLEIAKNVAAFVPEALFVVAGDGDLLPNAIQRAHELGITDKVIFTGFLTGKDVHQAFQMADVYVMPSVSEPFGLVALESVKNSTPAIISKQSGVSEVLTHCLRADFNDARTITDLIVSVLRHPELQAELRENGHAEAKQLTLDRAAQKVIDVYAEVRQ